MNKEEDLDQWTLSLYNLYLRCRNFSSITLPSAGGILDQEEYLMQCLSIIHERVEKEIEEKHEDMVRQVEQKMRIARLTGRP